jgi:pimeloyl-ACP methyl ester carboxylesterase
MSFVAAGDGIRIHYEVTGRRDGSPVLMIQGLGADLRGWNLQRARFGRQHLCVAIDNRGVGRSDAPPGPYSLQQMADDAMRVLDAEGIEAAHVMGASMGGVIAQIIGVLYPERVRSLVLSCTACRHQPWRVELLEEWADDVGARGMSALVGDEGLTWLIGPRLHRRFGTFINILGRIVLGTRPESFVAQVRAILDAPDALREELRSIDAPTLVITGTQDALTPVGDAEELAELVPGARLVLISGAAHGLMAEAPNAFNDAVLRFLAEVDGSDASSEARAVSGPTRSARPTGA